MKISETVSQQLLRLLSPQYSGGALSVGDTFTARIISVENGLLLMQLADGGKMSAQVKTDAQYSVGNLLRLEVIEEKEGQLYVRETGTTAPQAFLANEGNEPAELLKSLNLPRDNKRMEIVRAILDMGVKPGTDLVEKTSDLMADKLMDSPKQAVFAVLNRMENKDEYFPILEKFEEGTFHFMDKWQNLMNRILHQDNGVKTEIDRRLLVRDIIQGLELASSSEQIAEAIRQEQVNLSPYSQEEGINDLKTSLMELFELDPSGDNLPELIEQDINGISFLSKDQKDVFIRVLKDLSEQIMDKLDSAQGNAEDEGKTAGWVIKESISPKLQENGLSEVDKWIADVDGKLEVIEKVLINSGDGESEKLMAEVRELKTAVRFFQDITSYEAFVQIPVELKDNSTECELYIMKRKGARKKIKADDFTLFLSLTTKNLGVVDTFVNVRNKNVMLRVMAEDERLFDYFMREYRPLYESLQSKGFRLYELKCSLKDEKINLFNAMKKASELSPEQNTKIDVKV